jgi:uncharacterized protein (TIGR03086 family)
MMDPVEQFERCCGATNRVVAGVRPSAMAKPTPCAHWDVHAVLNHVVGTLVMFADTVETGTPAAPPDPLADGAPDLVGSGPLAAYQEATERALKASRREGAVEATYPSAFGDLPGGALFGFTTLDVLVHGWDIAKATGQQTTLDPELAEAVLGFARHAIMPAMRDASIGPEVDVPTDAPVTDRLVAFLGRRP